MRKTNVRLLSLAACAAAMSLFSAPAHAGGCNSVVDIFRWGCAPWDNNNGPNYPFYRKVQTSVPANGAQVRIKDNSAEVLVNGQWLPVVGGTAAIVAQGGGNIVAQGGGNIVAAGGGNLRALTGQ